VKKKDLSGEAGDQLPASFVETKDLFEVGEKISDQCQFHLDGA